MNNYFLLTKTFLSLNDNSFFVSSLCCLHHACAFRDDTIEIISTLFRNIPGRSGGIRSYRTGIKSFATRLTGFDRLPFAEFRCNPLCSFDIRWSDPSSSDQIHTFRTGQICSRDLAGSGLILGNMVPRNGRNLWFHMTPDFMIKPFNHWFRNLSDYTRIQEFR